MARILKSIIALFAILSVIGMVCVPTALAEEMSIRGVIYEEGMILTDDGEEFTLTENGMREELMEHVGERVDVKGAVSESEDGEKFISVTKYSLITEE